MVLPKAEGWFALDSIDLTGVGSANLMAGWQTPPEYGFAFEIRLDAPDGKSLGSAALNPPGKGQQFTIVHVPLQGVTDGQYHTLYVLSKPKNAAEKATAGLTFIQFNAK